MGRHTACKVGGKRVSLTAFDHALGALPGVRRAHCLALPRRDGRLGAVVALDPETIPHTHEARRALIRRLRDALAPRFENAVLPRYWRFVEHWPKTTAITKIIISRAKHAEKH